MTTYTDVFGGANIYPSEISYSALDLSGDVTLSWPDETSSAGPFVTKIIDVTAGAAGRSIIMPDATKAGNGETALINNLGDQSVTVKDSSGSQILVVAPGTVWQLYLTSNATAAGTWETLQYGSSVSSASASSLVGNGIVAVGTSLQQAVPVLTISSNYSIGSTDRARMFLWTGTSGTFTLPAPPSSDWFCYVRNSGSGAISIDPAGTVNIDGGSALSMQPGESAIVTTDGSNYYTVGYGRSATFAFDYAVVNIAGTGTYTLTGTELNRVSYKFTGALTGNRNIIVPATIQQYWVDNQTSGAYTLTIKTASGTGLSIAAGQRAIFYCDGVNVVDADTSTVSLPVQVSQGGTGAVSASAARINLGATSLGDTLFTAASTSTVWAALGTAPYGTIDGGTF